MSDTPRVDACANGDLEIYPLARQLERELAEAQRQLAEVSEALVNLIERVQISGGLGQYRGGTPWAMRRAKDALAAIDATKERK